MRLPFPVPVPSPMKYWSPNPITVITGRHCSGLNNGSGEREYSFLNPPSVVRGGSCREYFCKVISRLTISSTELIARSYYSEPAKECFEDIPIVSGSSAVIKVAFFRIFSVCSPGKFTSHTERLTVSVTVHYSSSSSPTP